MEWCKKFPWRRVLALLVVLCVILFVALKPAHGEEMFVKVDASSPDAVILSSTDIFESEALGKLISNQPVEMLDKTDGEYVMVRAEIKGRKVEGWVKKVILQKEPLRLQARVSESGAVENAAVASNGFNEQVENEMVAGSPQMKTALERVNKFEAGRNKAFGGSASDPDSTLQLRQVRDFGKDGKLID